MSIQKPQKMPTESGVYIFQRRKTPIYIGKAVNLKKRLVSYWRKNSSEKVRLMMREATKLEWIETKSEIEALLKEAELIKKFRPKYNILMRDDKNYFYVGITKEKFPKIFITHQPRAANASTKNLDLRTKQKNKRLSSKFYILSSYIGPFTSGTALHSTLRLLRRIFPYCTCRRPHKRACLNSQIGRCPGYCCLLQTVTQKPHKSNVPTATLSLNSWNITEYRKNIKSIIAVLESKHIRILAELKQGMKVAAKKQNFEKAAKLRDQIWGLENIFNHKVILNEMKNLRDPSLMFKMTKWNKIERVIQSILDIKNKISRVEGYDISNISGHDATGSMVVFIGGQSAKSEYRKFKIKTVEGANDVAMHKEVLKRRLHHSEWDYPDIILIDGGIGQLCAAAAAKSQFPNSNFQTISKSQISKVKNIEIVALAKREEELYTENRREPIPLKTMPPDVMHFFQNVRDESHRFAKKYHHKLREMAYRKK
ncbi:MAG: GIY-YIG nuclease family protein [Candidatus Sungbacteria bacterium]|nr:GIY-YIG nuclease family protein [Candidatus Sungbacteria bacterium]